MRVLFCCLLALSSLTLSAQKYGHLNFAVLISEMPGTAAAEIELKAYNDSLTTVGEQMVTDLRARANELEAQREELAPVEVRARSKELSDERDRILQFERQMGIDVERRRQELLGPIISAARAAVEAVAEEGGYQMIFDTSNFNTVLFGRDEDDVMPLVKAKLGM